MRRLAPIAWWLLLAGPARAAGGEDGGGSTLFYTAINLAALLVVVVWFARKPLREFFEDRREEIEGDLSSAAEMLRSAEERHAELQRKLIALDGELAEIRSKARQRAEAERERIVADAKAAAERIRDDAHAAVEQELRRARQELRQEVSDLALGLAADRLREAVGDADRDRLLDEFISRIERPNADGSPASGGS